MAKVEAQLKKTLTENEEFEVGKKKTPILGVTPIVDAQPAEGGVTYLKIEVLLENLGFAAVDIGRLGVEVFEGTPDSELARLLEVKEPPFPTPATTSPDTPSPSTMPEDQAPPSGLIPSVKKGELTTSSDSLARKKTEKPGQVYPVGSFDLEWIPMESLNRTLPVQFQLEQSQKRTIRLDYIIAEASKPKWYRFVISVSSKGSKETWNTQKVDAIVPGGRMGCIPYRKMVYETRVRQPAAATSVAAPPLPLNAISGEHSRRDEKDPKPEP